MTDREKVIKGLELCKQDGNFCYDKQCPYEKNFPKCVQSLLSDALELLKAQEPRVMTLEEVKNASIVWLEPITINLEEDIPIWFEGWAEPVESSEYDIHLYDFGNEVPAEAKFRDYGKTWRCWTSRPTEEQRNEAPWL